MGEAPTVWVFSDQASPKSPMQTWIGSRLVIKTLGGFKSLWNTPFEWMTLRASSNCEAMFLTSYSLSIPSFWVLIKSHRVPCSAYSSTKCTPCLSTMISNRLLMFLDLFYSLSRTSISLRAFSKISIPSSCSSPSKVKLLTATFTLVSRCYHSFTVDPWLP